MGLHPAMYCTPYLVSGNVAFLMGTCFYRSDLFEKPCISQFSSCITVNILPVYCKDEPVSATEKITAVLCEN